MKWIIAFILALTGCSSPAPKKDLVKPVVIAQATQGDVPIYIETIGNAYASITVDLRPEVQGKVIETHVKQGQYVKKDTLLYTIDPQIYKANLVRAQANFSKNQALLEFAKQKLERYSQLKKQDFVAAIALEELEGNVKSLKAQLASDLADIELAKINYDRAFIRSPVNGKISQFRIDVGNVVQAYDPNALTEILVIEPIEIRFSYPQKDFLEIQKYFKEGKLKFKVILPDESYLEEEGEVSFIDNKIDLASGTILLKGRVPNAKQKVWPGAFVRVQVFLTVKKNAVIVPQDAVQIGQKGPYVFVINNDLTADLRLVKTGQKFGTQIIVEEGVAPGEQVVTDGQINLRPGTKVSIKHAAL